MLVEHPVGLNANNALTLPLTVPSIAGMLKQSHCGDKEDGRIESHKIKNLQKHKIILQHSKIQGTCFIILEIL